MRAFLASLALVLAFGFGTANAADSAAIGRDAVHTEARFIVLMPQYGAALDLAASEVVRLAAEHARSVTAARIDILEDPDGMRALSDESPRLRDRRTASVYDALVDAGLPQATLVVIDRSGAGELAVPDAARADDLDMPYVEIVVYPAVRPGQQISAKPVR